jgi:hypothetical protein
MAIFARHSLLACYFLLATIQVLSLVIKVKYTTYVTNIG